MKANLNNLRFRLNRTYREQKRLVALGLVSLEFLESFFKVSLEFPQREVLLSRIMAKNSLQNLIAPRSRLKAS